MTTFRKAEATELGTVVLAPEVEAKLREWVQRHADYQDFKAKMEAAKDRSDEIAADVIPIIKATEQQMVRIDNAIIAYKSMTRGTVKYKEMFAAAMDKVNAATQRVLEELQKEATEVKTYESLQVKQLDWLGRAWDKVKDTVMGWWQELVSALSDGADELEQIVAQAEGEVSASKRVDKRVHDRLMKAVSE